MQCVLCVALRELTNAGDLLSLAFTTALHYFPQPKIRDEIEYIKHISGFLENFSFDLKTAAKRAEEFNAFCFSERKSRIPVIRTSLSRHPSNEMTKVRSVTFI